MKPRNIKITRDGTIYRCPSCEIGGEGEQWLLDQELQGKEIVNALCEHHQNLGQRYTSIEPYIQTPISPKFRVINDDDITKMKNWLDNNK